MTLFGIKYKTLKVKYDMTPRAIAEKTYDSFNCEFFYKTAFKQTATEERINRLKNSGIVTSYNEEDRTFFRAFCCCPIRKYHFDKVKDMLMEPRKSLLYLTYSGEPNAWAVQEVADILFRYVLKGGYILYYE